MTSLFTLQLVCCTVSAMLAFQLAFSSLQVRWKMRRYEVSRWLLFTSMVLISVHYLLQMTQGLRAQGSDVGAVVNILFYTPVSFAITLSIVNVESTANNLRRYCLRSAVAYVLIIALFVIGVLYNRSLHIGNLLYVMLGLFVVSMVYFIVVIRHETAQRTKKLQQTYGSDLIPFLRYSRVSLTLLYFTAVLLPIIILYDTLLLYIGPLMLLTIVFFIQSFISLGYYIMPKENTEETNEEKASAANGAGGSTDDNAVAGIPVCEAATGLSDERRRQIEQRLSQWCAEKHYQNCNATIYSLATDIGCNKNELTEYFNQSVHPNFRTWLSDIRFNEAMRMMKAFPAYSNDAISAECGFSSHTQIYRLFKQKTGLSPSQWRDKFA